MIYDQQYVDKYRALAITNVEELIVGNHYFGYGGKEFTIVEIITYNESYARQGLVYEHKNGNELAYIVADDPHHFNAGYLKDNNIGASYNPWLIFKDRETAKEYYDGLEIDYDRSDDDFFYSDFDWESEDYDDFE